MALVIQIALVVFLVIVGVVFAFFMFFWIVQQIGLFFDRAGKAPRR